MKRGCLLTVPFLFYNRQPVVFSSFGSQHFVMNKRIFLSALLTGISLIGFAQSPSADLAVSHNRLLRERVGDGVYKLIGPYKVVGSSYLFNEKNKGDLFSTGAKAYNIFLSYNTHNQQIEFYSTSNPDKPLVKEPGEVDSFTLHANIEIGITEPLPFVYGPHIGSKEKAYYMVVYAGSKFSIYKKYKSDLGFVSSNYIQSELRQFDLELEYFYRNAEGKLKKIKPNTSVVNKEFKGIKDLTGVITDDAFMLNPDKTFKKAFEYLNR